MKGSFKKILAFSVSVALMIPSLTLFSYAQTPKLKHGETEIINSYKFPEDTPVPSNKSIKPYSFYSNNSNGFFRFYNQLNSTQKFVYNKIVEAKAGYDTQGTVNITFPDPSPISAPTMEEMQKQLQNAIYPAVTAVMDDYPEFFWIGAVGMSYNYYDGDTYSCPEAAVEFSLDTDAYPDWNSVHTYYDGMMNQINAFEAVGSSRYAKLKSIHDQIAKKVKYDSDFNNPIAHQPTSVFFEPYEPVCEGYAEALKLICDKYDIPCIIVVGKAGGGGHAWNYVQMEDGNWYAVDLTWDDQGDIMYDFFLSGSDSKNARFSKAQFTSDHVATGEHYQGIDFALIYPTLSKRSYTGGLLTWNSNATFDNTKKLMYIGKDAVLAQQFIGSYSGYSYLTPADHTVKVSGLTTGATVTVKSNIDGNTNTYTVIRWGDINASNKVDATDYNQIVNVVKGKVQQPANEKEIAADLNEDGVIDGFDAVYLDLYRNNIVDKQP